MKVSEEEDDKEETRFIIHINALHLHLFERRFVARKLHTVYAFHTRLIPSVKPTSFVSNSYSPIRVNSVAMRSVHSSDALVFGTRFLGK